MKQLWSVFLFYLIGFGIVISLMIYFDITLFLILPIVMLALILLFSTFNLIYRTYRALFCTVKGFNDLPTSICFSRDSKLCAIGSWDKTVKLFNLNDKKTTKIIDSVYHINCLDFSCDGKTLACAALREIIIWDINKQKTKFTIKQESNTSRIVYSPNSKFIASGGEGKSIKLWDTETGLFVREFIFNDLVYNFVFHPNGQTIFGISGNILLEWSISDSTVIRKKVFGYDKFTSLDVDRSGSHIVVSTDKGVFIIFSYLEFKPIYAYKNNFPILNIKFYDDKKSIFLGDESGSIATHSLVYCRGMKIQAHSEFLTSLCISPNGKYLGSCSGDLNVKIWMIDKL